VTYLYHDHLGSTVASSEQEGIRYWPYGDTRAGAVSTAYQYTGQELDSGSGLYYYRARWYDASSGRFIQADSIVPAPGNPQSLNRYAYVYNNPLRYTDPTGHISNSNIMRLFGAGSWEDVLAEFRVGGQLEGRWGFLALLTRMSAPGELITGPIKSANLWRSRSGPRDRFDHGRPYPSTDSIVRTISSGTVDGTLTLLEHLPNGSARPISPIEAGSQGDIWESATRDSRGWMRGQSGHVIVTMDPYKVDSVGAVLDAASLLLTGMAAAGTTGGWAIVAGVIAITGGARDVWRLIETIESEGNPTEVGLAATDVGLGMLSLRYQYWPDCVSLAVNLGSSLYVEVIR